MRIAILMPVISPWSRLTAIHLAALGHHVDIIDFQRQRQNDTYLSKEDGFHAKSLVCLRQSVRTVHLLESVLVSNLRYLTCAPHISRICRHCGADVLLSLYGGGWATMAWASRFRPFAVFVVGSDVLMLNTFNKIVARHVLASASTVFANGGYLAAKTRELAPQASILPMLLGVDTVRFAPQRTTDSPIRVLCTRGFGSVYNNEYLIQGLATIKKDLGDYRIVFVSSGPRLSAVKTLADHFLTEQTRRRVSFLGGVTDEEMLQNLQSAHVYVSLSRSDGTSISLLEALSCGLFPILSDIPQNREWIDPGLENGILVPLDQPKILGKALERAILDSALRERASVLNRKLVVERADARKNSALLAANLEVIVGSYNKNIV